MGVERDEVLGKSLYRVFELEDAERIIDGGQHLLSGEADFARAQLEITVPGTSETRVLDISRTVLHAEGASPSILSVATDITDIVRGRAAHESV